MISSAQEIFGQEKEARLLQLNDDHRVIREYGRSSNDPEDIVDRLLQEEDEIEWWFCERELDEPPLNFSDEWKPLLRWPYYLIDE